MPRARKLDSPDFKVFYTAARHALTEPANLYKVSPDRYLYPPSTALVLTPFAFSEYYAFHQWSWHLLLAGMVWFLAASGGAALAAMALLTRYLAISFGYGQINLVVMGLLAASALTLKTRGSGALWSLAVSFKVYPLVFAPAFLLRKNWGAIFLAALCGFLLALLPLLAWGPGLGLQLYGEFFQALDSKGLPLHSHNQSLAAFLLRLFTDQSFHLHALGDVQWTLLALPPNFVHGFALFLGAGIAGLSWWKAHRSGRGAESYLSAAAFCIIFLSHIVWKDYLLFLFFPLAEQFRHGNRKASYWIAGVFLALITLSSPEILGPQLATRFDAGCVHLWAAVLVWITWLRR